MLALLPPSSSVTGLTCCGGARHHLIADLGRPGEDDLAHVGVRDEPLPDDRTPAGQHLEQSVGQPGLERELAEPDRGERRPLGGLEQHGVARGERGREPPRRDRHREVPRHDDADDAERLVEGHVEAAGDRDLLADQPLRARRVVSAARRGRGRPPTGVPIGCPELRTSSAASSSTWASTAAANAPQRAAPARRAPARPTLAARRRARAIASSTLLDVELLDVAQHLLGRRVDQCRRAHAVHSSRRSRTARRRRRRAPANSRRSSGVSSGCHCTPTHEVHRPGSSTRLDHAVGDPRADDQPVAELGDGLVVVALHVGGLRRSARPAGCPAPSASPTC